MASQRKVGLLLGVAIFLIPIIFSWFLLRKGHSTLARIISFGWLAFFLFTISGHDTPFKAPEATAQLISAAPQKVDTAKPADSTNKIASDSETIKQVEQRIKENQELLKKYYATSESVNKAAADVLLLSVTKTMYSGGKTKEEKELNQRASKLLPQAQQQVRELYASSVEEIFVKSGMDVQVRAAGGDKSQLSIVYALMSQPLVYKFQNEMSVHEMSSDAKWQEQRFFEWKGSPV